MNPVAPPIRAPSTIPTTRATTHDHELPRIPPIVMSRPKKAMTPSVCTSAIV